jgi:hypothetical protein
MIERLMTDKRSLVVGALISLVGVTALLWFIRGGAPDLSNLMFFALSMLLVPLFYFAVYGLLYFIVSANRLSARTVRLACSLFFMGAGLFLACSTLLALYDFATHRSLPTPNLAALGVALGAMKAWGLQSMATASR